MAGTSNLQEYARIQEEKRGKNLVIPLVKGYLLTQWQQSSRDIAHVHPSEMAKKDWCERATWYRIHLGYDAEAESKKFNFTLQTIFDEGHQIHDKWQTWLKNTGALWGDWECMICREWRLGWLASDLDRRELVDGADYEGMEEYCPVFSGEPGVHDWHYREVALTSGIITGHEDGAVDDRLVEFKSVGLGTLRHDAPSFLAKFYHKNLKLYDLDGLWNALDKPLRSHVRQANVYLWLAKEMGLNYPKCSIVYEYKPNQQSREYVISMSEDIVEPLIERAYSCEWEFPPRCPYGGCKNCKAYEDGTGKRAGFSAGREAGTADSTPAGQRRTGPTHRRDRANGQCPDEAIPALNGLAEVPGYTISSSGGRRKVLRTKSGTTKGTI